MVKKKQRKGDNIKGREKQENIEKKRKEEKKGSRNKKRKSRFVYEFPNERKRRKKSKE